jgi:flagellar hook-basal body complex protein FliE
MTTTSISTASRIAKSDLHPAPSRDVQSPREGRTTFGEVLAESLEKVNHLQKEAGQAIQGLRTDGRMDVAKARIAAETASHSFELMTQVRHHLVKAYQEHTRKTL